MIIGARLSAGPFLWFRDRVRVASYAHAFHGNWVATMCADNTETCARRFLVSGVVQGVFFRASARQEAERLGLCGHARNLRDGRVEVVAFGPCDRIHALERWLWKGPPAAQVDTVEAEAHTGQVSAGFKTL